MQQATETHPRTFIDPSRESFHEKETPVFQNESSHLTGDFFLSMITLFRKNVQEFNK